jgi:hypothetical protein
LPGLERQAHGRIASKSWMTGGNTLKSALTSEYLARHAYFLSKIKVAQIFNSLSPTGC